MISIKGGLIPGNVFLELSVLDQQLSIIVLLRHSISLEIISSLRVEFDASSGNVFFNRRAHVCLYATDARLLR